MYWYLIMRFCIAVEEKVCFIIVKSYFSKTNVSWTWDRFHSNITLLRLVITAILTSICMIWDPSCLALITFHTKHFSSKRNLARQLKWCIITPSLEVKLVKRYWCCSIRAFLSIRVQPYSICCIPYPIHCKLLKVSDSNSSAVFSKLTETGTWWTKATMSSTTLSLPRLKNMSRRESRFFRSRLRNEYPPRNVKSTRYLTERVFILFCLTNRALFLR